MDEELALAAILENIIRLPSNTSLTVHTATGNGEGFISKHKTIHVKNLYKVLGLQRNATSADILGAYKRLSRILHPDKAHDKAIAEQMKDAFQEVVGAKEALLDASTRRTYDKDNLETMRKEEDEELAVAASPSAPIISSHTITDPLWKFGAHVTNKIANRVEDAVAAAAFVAIGAAAAKAASYLSSKAKAAPPSSPPSPPPPIPVNITYNHPLTISHSLQHSGTTTTQTKAPKASTITRQIKKQGNGGKASASAAPKASALTRSRRSVAKSRKGASTAKKISRTASRSATRRRPTRKRAAKQNREAST